MSAYHQELPHGAGLIMISAAYYQHFVDCHVCDERFVEMAKALGKTDAASAQDFVDVLVQLQHDCGVADFKMSDFGIEESELENTVTEWLSTIGMAAQENAGVKSGENAITITIGDIVLDGVLYDTALAQEIKASFPLQSLCQGMEAKNIMEEWTSTPKT